jgi:hypothetical protein
MATQSLIIWVVEPAQKHNFKFQESDETFRSHGRAAGKEARLQARALSIISSQMPLDLRISSTSSRAAPFPPTALVV